MQRIKESQPSICSVWKNEAALFILNASLPTFTQKAGIQDGDKIKTQTDSKLEKDESTNQNLKKKLKIKNNI